MSEIFKLFTRAQLAEASYAIFDASVYGNKDRLKITLDIANKSRFNGDFSAAHAVAFADNYQVIDQYTAPPLMLDIGGMGFSATLFQNIETRRYTFAVRGTEFGLADLVNADFQGIVINGVAMDQLVEMYNYWESLNSAGIYQAAKLETMGAGKN